MKHLGFFDSIEKIVLKDDLLVFLWVNNDWLIDFSYTDIVKTAGHSCWTVAGAYLIAQKWLKALFWDELPNRGQIKVEIKKEPTDDNAWVIWCVLSNITWATTNYGFWWIPTWEFNRRNTLFYTVNIESDVRFTDLITWKSVEVNYRPWRIVNPMKILKSAIWPDATEFDKKTFPVKFQNMVKTIFENSDKVIDVKEV